MLNNSTFTIISETRNAQYEYTNTTLFVNGGFAKDARTDTLREISGSVYHNASGGQGEYVGNFNGYDRNGQMKYSVSEMDIEDALETYAAIGDIVEHINGENEE